MKFTREDLMKAMGLAVGDKVIIKVEETNVIDEIIIEKRIANIVSDNNFGVGLECNTVVVPIERLINKWFEILRPMRVGDLKCSNDCKNCPLRSVCNFNDYQGKNLYEVFELTIIHDDQEIHDLLKARLDKEVQYND